MNPNSRLATVIPNTGEFNSYNPEKGYLGYKSNEKSVTPKLYVVSNKKKVSAFKRNLENQGTTLETLESFNKKLDNKNLSVEELKEYNDAANKVFRIFGTRNKTLKSKYNNKRNRDIFSNALEIQKKISKDFENLKSIKVEEGEQLVRYKTGGFGIEGKNANFFGTSEQIKDFYTSLKNISGEEKIITLVSSKANSKKISLEGIVTQGISIEFLSSVREFKTYESAIYTKEKIETYIEDNSKTLKDSDKERLGNILGIANSKIKERSDLVHKTIKSINEMNGYTTSNPICTSIIDNTLGDSGLENKIDSIPELKKKNRDNFNIFLDTYEHLIDQENIVNSFSNEDFPKCGSLDNELTIGASVYYNSSPFATVDRAKKVGRHITSGLYKTQQLIKTGKDPIEAIKEIKEKNYSLKKISNNKILDCLNIKTNTQENTQEIKNIFKDTYQFSKDLVFGVKMPNLWEIKYK